MGPVTFAVADQNFDHKADLVLAGTQNATKGGAWGITWGIGVSLGNGDGTFQPAVFYQAGTDANTDYVAVGDFNGDGIPDVATVGSSGVWLFTGKGGGALNPGVLTPFQGASPTNFDWLKAADFRKNGKLDLVVATPTGFGPGIVVPAHLRSPNLVDLVVQGAGAVSVLLNQGKGNFEDGVWTPYH